uniref:Uncharacterized protein n=1 Tax=Opuntia streptacantha TaxID=393608 RepID=A0A7C8YNK9_OPUST
MKPMLSSHSGIRIPATASIAHLLCINSACANHLSNSGSDPNPRGSKPKSPGRLPSSHSGGELPGNHSGLSGGSGSQTLDIPPLVALTLIFPIPILHFFDFP